MVIKVIPTMVIPIQDATMRGTNLTFFTEKSLMAMPNMQEGIPPVNNRIIIDGNDVT